MAAKAKFLALASLVTGALAWGLIWYPFRVLDQAGIRGAFATLVTYAVALLMGVLAFGRGARRRPTPMLAAIAVSAGWTNLAYVLAVIQGDVVRVMLLFFLAPLWTIIFSRLLLGERMSGLGGVVIAFSVAGAVVMLWNAEAGFPFPREAAEWLGLSSGVAFALSNVLSRRAKEHSVIGKSFSIWVGVTLVCLAYGAWQEGFVPELGAIPPGAWALAMLVGLVLFAVNPVVQHGLAHTSANQAIVIMLSELVFAAVSAWFLAGEAMGPREWLGGGMIVTAALFSGRLAGSPARESAGQPRTLG